MCNMSDQDGFSFSLRSQPQGKRIPAEDAERLLLERLKRCERDFLSVLSDLAYFYGATGRQRQAQAYLEGYIANTDDPEKRAGCYLGLGQLMEQMKDFESAISFYSRAFVLEPESTRTWYRCGVRCGVRLAFCTLCCKVQNDPATPENQPRPGRGDGTGKLDFDNDWALAGRKHIHQNTQMASSAILPV